MKIFILLKTAITTVINYEDRLKDHWKINAIIIKS